MQHEHRWAAAQGKWGALLFLIRWHGYRPTRQAIQATHRPLLQGFGAAAGAGVGHLR